MASTHAISYKNNVISRWLGMETVSIVPQVYFEQIVIFCAHKGKRYTLR